MRKNELRERKREQRENGRKWERERAKGDGA